MKKIFVSFAMFALILLPAVTFAQDADNLMWGGQEDEIGTNLGLGNEDPRVIISAVINVALGFLGIIAVVLILLGGFKWMTAQGNEDKIDEAKKLLAAGIIGLVIIMAAWGIAKFVVGAIYNATA